MPSAHVVKVPGRDIVIEAVPLTPEAFAPFGDVVENPRPDVHPSSAGTATSLPFHAVTANQGSAIKYQHVSSQVNLYDQAPSGCPGSAIMSMFVCAARARIPDPAPTSVPGAGATAPDSPGQPPPTFQVSVLERHPFTTQTFIPLAANPAARYLVIVAPTLPSATGDNEAALPVPSRLPPSTANYPRPLPGGGLPDLRRLRAFVATATQAVTYGAGTWHAPMIALGEAGKAVDFVVVQFANGVGVEDCQEAFLEAAADEKGVWVKLRPSVEGRGAKRRAETAKL
ncbi:ureidoglycolate hydrolase [Achaetomium macrosporum]|uniref:Ureidoglycolate hydrolase n=1 Tax=Achaetomium macrosporum TaxID=79813 RepID=A0AAN7HDX3_9PEZI|nr:ureidoglycolate hydrolase [Achaetomium macrosporum]